MTENEEFVKERKTLERKKKIVEIFFSVQQFFRHHVKNSSNWSDKDKRYVILLTLHGLGIMLLP